MTVRVKVCGMTTEEDVLDALAAGADAVGFVSGFPESPRNLPLGEALKMASAVPPFASAVLVTNTETLEGNVGRLEGSGVSAVQLYGDRPPFRRRLLAMNVRLIAPFRVGADSAQAGDADAVLVDSYVPGVFGGSGKAADWGECRKVRDAVAPRPLILSGGLTAENVCSAIRRVEPFAVDVSSGVERAPGRKDIRRVREFVARAKSV